MLSSNGTGVFAMQGALNDPAHQRVYLDKAHAAAEPMEKSTLQVELENQAVALPHREEDQLRPLRM
ncbi:MAG: XVIPCD domain-containing protein [Pseudoxanthomonas sp.]